MGTPADTFPYLRFSELPASVCLKSRLGGFGLGLLMAIVPLLMLAASVALTWLPPRTFRGATFLMTMLATSWAEFALQDCWRQRKLCRRAIQASGSRG